MNNFFKNDVVRPALLVSCVLALHLIILSWAAGLSPTSSLQSSRSDHTSPALTVRIVEATKPPIVANPKTEPPTPPGKASPARKSIVARARPKPSPSLSQEGRDPPSSVEPLAAQGETYEIPDNGSPSESRAGEGVDPKPGSSGANLPLPSAGLPDPSKQAGPEPLKVVPTSPDPGKLEARLDPERRGLVADASAFPYQIASFPRPIVLAYAVHAPKDYRESSGSSGTAELRTDLNSSPNGLDQFSIKVEIDLSWLLKRMVGGSLHYESQGQVGAHGPQVGRYSEKIGERAPRWLEVDAQKNLMKSFSIANLGVPPTTQDRLSIIWLLGMMARADPAQLEKGKVFSIPMFTFRQTYSGRFESMGNEVLESPAGILQALHVAYTSQDVAGDKVDIWLGYDYEMQPVRIRWEEAQGRVIDLILLKKPQ